MGLDIIWQDCNGKPMESVGDPHNFLHRLLPGEGSESVLAKVDWYGDTYFNYLQIPQFLEEWSRMGERANTPQERALINGVRDLALKAQTDRGLLRFVGD